MVFLRDDMQTKDYIIIVAHVQFLRSLVGSNIFPNVKLSCSIHK